jgi:hypothetical protein
MPDKEDRVKEEDRILHYGSICSDASSDSIRSREFLD